MLRLDFDFAITLAAAHNSALMYQLPHDPGANFHHVPLKAAPV
jgi:hypothetical protein